ncbi:major facilitator superfamily domain-containing protein [Phlebopus sp. FC_14]|nr:major facilitator superfamily domain-containing protein [Phlebopus sp. FC_14]
MSSIAQEAFIALSATSTRHPSNLSENDVELTPVTHASTNTQDVSITSHDPLVKPRSHKARARVQLVTLCWFLFLEGWNDGANGPLLPRIQQVYGIGYAVVSLIFVLACVGFITGALLNVVLSEKLGFGKVMVLGAVLQVAAYAMECAAPPFPVFVFGYFINGIGLALQNAQSIAYVACFKEGAETKMGILMAAYGAGAFSSPLVATQFSQLRHWSFHYFTSLGIALSNITALTLVFRLKRQDECLAEVGIAAEPKSTSEHSHFRQIFSLKDVHLLACFVLFYVGAEVTIGGWIVTYIIDVRGGGASSGYISSGFFGGLMFGRLALMWVNEKVGERRAQFLYAVIAIALEFIVWFVPSLVGDAVAVAAIGTVMGPMYPIVMNHCGRVLPRWLLTGSIGWVAGVGQAGSALVPFMAGAVASKAGIKSLQPLLVGILSLMTVLWAFVPKSSRRPD